MWRYENHVLLLFAAPPKLCRELQTPTHQSLLILHITMQTTLYAQTTCWAICLTCIRSDWERKRFSFFWKVQIVLGVSLTVHVVFVFANQAERRQETEKMRENAQIQTSIFHWDRSIADSRVKTLNNAIPIKFLPNSAALGMTLFLCKAFNYSPWLL